MEGKTHDPKTCERNEGFCSDAAACPECERANFEERVMYRLTSLRPEVAEFASMMEQRLRENERRGGWNAMGIAECAVRSSLALGKALDRFGVECPNMQRVVAMQCADAANYLMMAADNLVGLGAVAHDPGDAGAVCCEGLDSEEVDFDLAVPGELVPISRCEKCSGFADCWRVD